MARDRFLSNRGVKSLRAKQAADSREQVDVDSCHLDDTLLIDGVRSWAELDLEVPVLGSNPPVLGSDQALLRAFVWRR